MENKQSVCSVNRTNRTKHKNWERKKQENEHKIKDVWSTYSSVHLLLIWFASPLAVTAAADADHSTKEAAEDRTAAKVRIKSMLNAHEMHFNPVWDMLWNDGQFANFRLCTLWKWSEMYLKVTNCIQWYPFPRMMVCLNVTISRGTFYCIRFWKVRLTSRTKINVNTKSFT